MILPMKAMTEYIAGLGAAKIPHSRTTYLAHAVGVYKYMKSWEADDELCRAAMFHSIYGTEGFQDFTLPLDRRRQLRELTGDRAELLAYANCAMDRDSFFALVDKHQDRYLIADRLSGEPLDLSSEEFEDLMRLHLCDYLEQVERTEGWDYRRTEIRLISERVGGAALESYHSTFARAPRSAGESQPGLPV